MLVFTYQPRRHSSRLSCRGTRRTKKEDSRRARDGAQSVAISWVASCRVPFLLPLLAPLPASAVRAGAGESSSSRWCRRPGATLVAATNQARPSTPTANPKLHRQPRQAAIAPAVALQAQLVAWEARSRPIARVVLSKENASVPAYPNGRQRSSSPQPRVLPCHGEESDHSSGLPSSVSPFWTRPPRGQPCTQNAHLHDQNPALSPPPNAKAYFVECVKSMESI